MRIDQIIRIAAMMSDAQELVTLGDKSAAISSLNNAKERLFTELYFSEFETTDGELQHPDGYNFEQWLEANKALFAFGEMENEQADYLKKLEWLSGLEPEELIAHYIAARTGIDYDDFTTKYLGLTSDAEGEIEKILERLEGDE